MTLESRINHILSNLNEESWGFVTINGEYYLLRLPREILNINMKFTPIGKPKTGALNPPFGFGYLAYHLLNKLNLGNVKEDDLKYHEIWRYSLLYHFQSDKIICYEDLNYGDWHSIKLPNTSIKCEFQENEQVKVHILQYENPVCCMVESSSLKIIPTIGREDYIDRVIALQNKIREGEVYQASIAATFHAEIDNPISFFLERYYRIPYSAYFKSKDLEILSFSPELFFSIEHTNSSDQLRIISQPIKGTAKRGDSESEDLEIIAYLTSDPKELAELAMIVDLVRNDVCQTTEDYQVSVDNLFRVTTYDHLHHLDARIVGILKNGLSLESILRSVFPAGSISGAPKLNAIKYIDELEIHPRGVWTGALVLTNLTDFLSANVAIRTGVVNGRTLTFHSGCGITLQSDPVKEYDELILKSKIWGVI